MTLQNLIVTGVKGQAKSLGVQVGWRIYMIDGDIMDSGTQAIFVIYTLLRCTSCTPKVFNRYTSCHGYIIYHIYIYMASEMLRMGLSMVSMS